MSDWVEKPLGALVSFQKGRKVTTSEHRLEGFEPYLGASALVGNATEYGDSRLGVRAEAGEVLMLWDGERSGLVGKGREGVLSSTVAKLTSRGEVVGDYLYYALDSRFEWIQNRRTGTGVPHVPKDLGRILHVVYPENTLQQRRIVEILGTMDVVIQQTEALIAKQQQLKAGLMHDLFTRGVTPTGQLRPAPAEAPHLYQDSPLGLIPKEWSVKRCNEVCVSIIDCKNRTPPITDDGHPVIRTPNVRHGQFVWTDLVYTDPDSYLTWTARGKPQPGDIVITREAPVGEVCMIPHEASAACLGQRMMLYRPNPERVNAHFMLQVLQSRQIRKHLDLISGGSTVGHVKVGDIRTLRLPCPSLSEQMLIATALSAAGSRIQAETAHLAKLHQLKQGLMQDLLTGRVPVPA